MVEGVHDLVLFFYKDNFPVMFLYFAGVVLIVLFVSDAEDEAEGTVADGVQDLVGLFQSLLGRLLGDHCDISGVVLNYKGRWDINNVILGSETILIQQEGKNSQCCNITV